MLKARSDSDQRKKPVGVCLVNVNEKKFMILNITRGIEKTVLFKKHKVPNHGVLVICFP